MSADEAALGSELLEYAFNLMLDARRHWKKPKSWKLSATGERLLLRSASEEAVRAHCSGREPTLFGIPVTVEQFVPHDVELVTA